MSISHAYESVTTLRTPSAPHERTVRISVSGDGSCFLHALLRSFYKPYIEASFETRRRICRHVRDRFAAALLEIDPTTGLTYYDSLAGGTMRELSADVPEKSLAWMRAELLSNACIGHTYVEFFSRVLGFNIYVWDCLRGEPYIMGNSDLRSLYLPRGSVVVAYIPGHYDAMGIARRDGSGIIDCLFEFQHPWIQALHSRLQALCRIGL